ncbi:MAG: citrate/2-methylcitrate synthase, partial [Isosphaeraceae bacterium]
MEHTARLTFGDQTIELPVIEGSEGELGVDITSLRAQTGLITLDPGFANTGANQSGITFVDGENGVLRYRGIPIDQLARHSNFVETSFLLIYGHLPSKQELDRFSARVTANAALHESFKHHFEGFPVDAPPMAMLSAMVNTLACFYP